MKKLTLVLFGLLCAVGIVSAQGKASWTIIHYLALDNNLEGEGFGDMREMAYAGSDQNVNIVVQYDRNEGYDESQGNWTGARRFVIQHQDPEEFSDQEIADGMAPYLNDGTTTDAEIAQQILDLAASDPAGYNNFLSYYGVSKTKPFNQDAVEDLGEVDMGDPQTLIDFMSWAIDNYPADHYLVVISDHGGGWHAIGPDEDSGQSMLELPEIDQALGTVREKYGIDKFDIVGFDACLMSQLEVASMLAPHAQYMIASQEVIPGEGWEYTHSINALKANPDMDAFELGSAIIDSYMEYYAGPGNRTKVDLGLVDLAQIPTLIDSLNAFATASATDTTSFLTAFGTARNNAQIFGTSAGDKGEYFSSIDLRDFMNLVSIQPSITEDLYLASQEVIASFDQAVVYAAADKKLPGSHGLAIYMPLNSRLYEAIDSAGSYVTAVPPTMSVWQDFLQNFYQATDTTLNADDLSLAIQTVFNVGPVASIEDQPTVLFTGTGQGIVDMGYYVILNAEDGSRIVADTSNISIQSVLPSGEVVVEYPNGSTNTVFSWGAEVPVLTDGDTQAYVVLSTDNTSSGEGTVEGALTTPDGDLRANLIFDLDTRTLSSIVAFQDDGSGYSAPFETSPQPGWTFTPNVYLADTDGSITAIPSSTTLTFGEKELSYSYQPAPKGAYEFQLYLSDLAGNKTWAVTDLAVDNSAVSGDYRGFTDTNYGINFPYPYTWYDPSVLVNDDGSETQQTSDRNPDKNNDIYVDYYDAKSADDVLEAFKDKFKAIDTMVLGEPKEISGAQVSGYLIPYTYTPSDGAHQGYAYVFYSPVSGYGYIIDLDFRQDSADELEKVATEIYNKVSFFAPVLFD